MWWLCSYSVVPSVLEPVGDVADYLVEGHHPELVRQVQTHGRSFALEVLPPPRHNMLIYNTSGLLEAPKYSMVAL